MSKTILVLPKVDAGRIPIAWLTDSVLQECYTALEKPTYEDWQAVLNQNSLSAVSMIVGQYDTPILLWTVAQRHYPDALLMCDEGTEQVQWRDLKTGDIWLAQEEVKNIEPSVELADVISPVVSMETAADDTILAKPESVDVKQETNPSPRSIKALSDERLIQELFIYATWGDEHERKVSERMFEAHERALRSPSIVGKAQRAVEDAKFAKSLEKRAYVLLRNAKNHVDDALKLLAEENKRSKDGRIQKHLRIQLEKKAQFTASKQKANYENKGYDSQLKPARMERGVHPNSVRHIQPSQQWTVLIDETGSQFNAQALSLDYQSRELGRVVALAIPDRSITKLPPLPEGFHATEVSDAILDQHVGKLLNTDVGVFGFTMQDDGLSYKQRWFDAIQQLAQWMMVLLPIDSSKVSSVKFNIEERGYAASLDLGLIAEGIESQLKTHFPDRFDQCHIQMQFIRKTDTPLNGYVDLIAHTWGSKSASTISRLKKTAWEGHCLLKPHQSAIERLYLATVNSKGLTPEHWYALCESIAEEPSTSLLHEVMSDLGQRVRQDGQLWLFYMDYVVEKLRNKTYRINALQSALDWLKACSPEGEQLTPMAQLYWESSRLAQFNHQGRIDQAQLSSALAQANRLRDEAADDACQVILRIATASTNFYEFGVTQSLLEKWAAEDVAIAGLLNHAKMQSTLGQLSAFQQRPQKAIERFDSALSIFAKLSDQRSAAKDIKQTQTYRLIACMDVKEKGWQSALHTHLQHQHETMVQIAERLAVSDDVLRYDHHLMLRGFVNAPVFFAEPIRAYLSVKENWESGDHHPWQWIEAYRGWLLAKHGLVKDALNAFNRAIELTTQDDHGQTIRWLGSVITLLANKLELAVNQQALDKDYLALLSKELNHAPFARLTSFAASQSKLGDEEMIEMLNELAPFNFH
jgi:tetratricopeptide (TPR) repeat protein